MDLAPKDGVSTEVWGLWVASFTDVRRDSFARAGALALFLLVLAAFDSASAVLTGSRATSAPSSRVIKLDFQPGALAMAAGSVWVTRWAEARDARFGRLYQFAADDGAVRTRTRVGGVPESIVFGFGSIWVGNGTDEIRPAAYPNTVTRVAARSGRVVRVVKVPDPAALAAGDDAVWALSRAATHSLLTKIEAEKSEVVVTRRVRGSSVRPRLATGGGSVWALTAATRPDGSLSPLVSRFGSGVGKPLAEIRLPGSGQDIAYVGGAVWVSTVVSARRQQKGEIWRLDPATNRPALVMRLASAGRLAVYQQRLWVVAGARTVVAVDPRTLKIAAERKSNGVIHDLAGGSAGLWAIDLFARRLLRVA
jgi:hypothetical protein